MTYVSADKRRELMGRTIEPMSQDEYEAILYAFGMTQEQMGLWLGISHRQGQRYANGEAPIPGPVCLLLRLMINRGITPGEVN